MNFLWAVGIIVVLTMALGIFVTMLNEDSEHYNSNGTVIVKTPVWLDKCHRIDCIKKKIFWFFGS